MQGDVPNDNIRKRKLILTSNNLRDIPETYEKFWFLEPEFRVPFRTRGGIAIDIAIRNRNALLIGVRVAQNAEIENGASMAARAAEQSIRQLGDSILVHQSITDVSATDEK